MRKVSLFDIVITMMLAGVAAWANAWANSSHSAIGSPQIDPFSLMANAKNLHSQESLNLKIRPDNGVVRY